MLHRDNASKGTGLHVSRHLYSCTPKKNKFTAMAFYKIHKDDESLRKQKEHMFLQKIKPTLNRTIS